jgi:hypothetical protein
VKKEIRILKKISLCVLKRKTYDIDCREKQDSDWWGIFPDFEKKSEKVNTFPKLLPL